MSDWERIEWLDSLIEKVSAKASETKAREGQGGQLGAYWSGHMIALGEIQMAAIRDLASR